ncbi:MAG: hypothetical protein HY645_01130 [Acidobacteria bacterium]|nr:hypothetical protein [Acidobacteriota bacterium]
MKSLLVTLNLGLTLVSAQTLKQPPPEASRCHAFVDYENVWTFEMVQNREGERVPILNIITLSEGEWDFRLEQIQIVNKQGKRAQVKKFSLDTGDPQKPYETNYLKILGNSFIGLDLQGEFDDFAEPAHVLIDLGDQRFELVPIESGRFDEMAEKINQVNFDSPNVKEDFNILKIEPIGKRSPKPR